MQFYDCPYIGNFIIPTDELIFFRGVGLNHQPVLLGEQFTKWPCVILSYLVQHFHPVCAVWFVPSMCVFLEHVHFVRLCGLQRKSTFKKTKLYLSHWATFDASIRIPPWELFFKHVTCGFSIDKLPFNPAGGSRGACNRHGHTLRCDPGGAMVKFHDIWWAGDSSGDITNNCGIPIYIYIYIHIYNRYIYIYVCVYINIFTYVYRYMYKIYIYIIIYICVWGKAHKYRGYPVHYNGKMCWVDHEAWALMNISQQTVATRKIDGTILIVYGVIWIGFADIYCFRGCLWLGKCSVFTLYRRP